MVHKTSTFASSLGLSLFFVMVTSMSEALMIQDNHGIMQMKSINPLSKRRLNTLTTYYPKGPWVRMAESPLPLPPVCRPQTLDPSIRCGCAVFRDDYEGEEQFERLEEGCNEELEFNISSGFAGCAEASLENTPFENRSFVRPSGTIRNGLLRSFLKEARDECAFTPAPLPPEIRESTYEVSLLGKDPRAEESRQGTENVNFDRNSTISPALRVPSERAHRRVRDLCMLILSRMKVRRKEAFCICCPRHMSCKRPV